MSWWKKLSDRRAGKREEPVDKFQIEKFPFEIELVEGEVRAEVHQTTFQATDEEIRCLAYFTRGLTSVDQAELAFFLKIYPGEDIYTIDALPLHFMSQVYRLASQGQLVNAGGFSQFGEGQFLGASGLTYFEPSHLPHLPWPEELLVMVALKSRELELVQNFLHTRLKALLARRHRYYPYPPWWDRKREALPVEEIFSKSILGRLHALPLQEGWCRWDSSQSLTVELPSEESGPGRWSYPEGGSLHLRLTPGSSQYLLRGWEDVPEGYGLVLLTEVDPLANGCLVWDPCDDPETPSAVVPPGSDGSQISGSFLVLIPEQEKEDFRLTEDGFSYFFTDHQFDSFLQALREKREWTLESESECPDFLLEWER